LGRGLAGPADLVVVQQPPHRPHVRAQLASDLGQRPCLPTDAVGEVGVQGGEAELGRSGGQALLGAATAALGGQLGLWGWCEAGLVEQAADDRGGSGEFSGELTKALLLAARCKVGAEVGEAQLDGAVLEAALLAVNDRETAADGEPARRWRWWWRYTCAWRAGRPTTPGDPLLPVPLGNDRGGRWGSHAHGQHSQTPWGLVGHGSPQRIAGLDLPSVDGMTARAASDPTGCHSPACISPERALELPLSLRTALACIMSTLDSVTPSTWPISASVSPS